MKSYIYLFFSIIILFSCSPAKKARKLLTEGTISQSNFYKIIKYDKYREWIIVEATINGSTKKYRLLFDTGAVSVISQPLADELNLPNIVERPIGSSTNDKQVSVFTRLDSINVGGIDFLDVGAVVLDFNTSPELSCLGMEVDGILGANMMRNGIWQVDYKNQELHFTDDRTKLSFQENIYDIAFTATRQGSPFVDIQFNGETYRIEFDTGKGGGVGLPYKKVKNVFQTFDETEYIKGFGMAGVGVFGASQDTVYKLSVKNIQLGEYQQDTLLIDIGRSTKPLVGNRFLKHFKVTFDWQMQLISLEPYTLDSLPLAHYESFGFGYSLAEEQLEVAFQWEKSPFYEQNIPLGSKIIKVNGKDIESLKLENFCTIKDEGLVKKDAKEVDLTLKLPDGTEKTIHLDAKEIL
jgi:hypothetical protein